MLRVAFRASGFVGLTAGFFAAARLHQRLVPERDRPVVFARYQHAWFRSLLDLFGVQVAVKGDPLSTMGKPRLVVSNHRSALDIAVVGWLFGGSLLSRGDLRRWPFLGRVAQAAGTIFVDREDARSGAAAVRAISERLAAGGSVSLFPEGTTFEDDVVRPFRRGAFSAAACSGCLVVPVGLAYDSSGRALFRGESFLVHLREVAEAPILRVAVRIGDPIPTPEETSAEALAAVAHAAVQDLVTAARLDCAALERS